MDKANQGAPAARNTQDVILAMVRTRRAIEKARRVGEGGNHTTDAVEKLCDAVDGMLGALMAEPSLRIDYLHAQAPTPVAAIAAPSNSKEQP